MRTLIVSDLHLGTRKQCDVLRGREASEALLARLEGVERLVLLGDVLELRSGLLREALAGSRELFERMGEVLDSGEVVLVPGNHDYALIAPWLDRRGADVEAEPLGPEQLLEPAEASPALETIAGWLGGAPLRVAYPGLWLREDVYAQHGHYLDCHLTIPTFERLAMGVMGRLVTTPAAQARSVEDYEALVAPIYAWINSVSQRAPAGRMLDGGGTVRAWRALAGHSRRGMRARALVAVFPAMIGALNRAGIGPLQRDLSGVELRRAGLRAMADVVERLGIEARHVIFGHTHRAGPFPQDEPAEWCLRDGGRLWNAGSWVFDTTFMRRADGESPYWPGVCIALDDDEEPRIERLLSDRSAEELRRSLTALPA